MTPVDSFKSPEEQLKDAKERIQQLEDTQQHLVYMNQGLESQLQLSGKIITQLQGQLHAKETKKGSSVRARTVGVRVLTSEEGRQEMEELHEEARQKEQRQAEEAARKAADNNAWCKRRADITRVFSGPLNKSKRKDELEDIAIALALPEGGKKDGLFQRISDHFGQHPDLKTSPRFEGLFNSRSSKRARVADFPTAGPSTIHRFIPPNPPPAFPASAFLQAFGPASASMIQPQLQHSTGPIQYPYSHYP